MNNKISSDKIANIKEVLNYANRFIVIVFFYIIIMVLSYVLVSVIKSSSIKSSPNQYVAVNQNIEVVNPVMAILTGVYKEEQSKGESNE